MNIYLKNAAIPVSSFAREFHGDCLSCGELIVHPLCPCCVSRGFRQWILGFPQEEKIILRRLEHFLRSNDKIHGRALRCISCGESKTNLCPKCFTDYLYKLSKEAGLGIKALAEFLFIFNFDFEGKDNFQELEAIGGY